MSPTRRTPTPKSPANLNQFSFERRVPGRARSIRATPAASAQYVSARLSPAREVELDFLNVHLRVSLFPCAGASNSVLRLDWLPRLRLHLWIFAADVTLPSLQ